MNTTPLSLLFDGIEGQVTLFDTTSPLSNMQPGFLRDWTSRNPLYSYKCDEATRQTSAKAVRKNKIADAIDAWMADKPNPTIAIHKIRVLRKGATMMSLETIRRLNTRDCC